MRKAKFVGFAVVTALALPPMVDTASFLPYQTVSISEAATVKLNATASTLYIRGTKKLTVQGTTKQVKWTSSAKSIATVSTTGKVTAKAKGTATITATVGTKKYTCKVTVKKKYKDGTYTGSGTGFRGGTTKVSISVKNDSITSIRIVSHEDTPRYFEEVVDTIIGEIISTHSTSVDVVSGATYSCEGIMDATASALKKAKY